jgi:chromosomal replication initiation ATPase DnaA
VRLATTENGHFEQGRPFEGDRATRRRSIVRLRREQVINDCQCVIDIAATMFNVNGRELRQPVRSASPICRVRQMAMYVAHVTLGYSMREVGDGFGRDRTTVLHACHQIEDLRDDAEFDAMVAAMERVVRAASRLTGATGN